MRRTGRKSAYIVLLCMILSALSFPESALAKRDVMISVNTEKKSVDVGEELSITYSVSVEDSSKFTVHQAPSFPGFTVVKKGELKREKIFRGSAYTVFVYSYRIKPKKAGVLKTGRATFVYGRVTYTTAPVEIVAKPPAADPQKAPAWTSKKKSAVPIPQKEAAPDSRKAAKKDKLKAPVPVRILPKEPPKVVSRKTPKVVKKRPTLKKEPAYKPGPPQPASEMLFKEDARHKPPAPDPRKPPVAVSRKESAPVSKKPPMAAKKEAASVSKKPIETQAEYKPGAPKIASELLIKEDDRQRVLTKKKEPKTVVKQPAKEVKKPEKIVKAPEYRPGPPQVVSEILIKDDIRHKMAATTKNEAAQKKKVADKSKPIKKETVKKPRKKRKAKPKILPSQKRGKLLVTASVDNAEPYTGEGIVYTFKLYHTLDYFGAPTFTPPGFTGFFVQELPQSRSTEKSRELGGEAIVEEVNYVLYPLVAGSLTIPPATLEFTEADGRSYTLKTNEVEIEMSSLPDYPTSFDTPYSGSVGEFKSHLKIESEEIIQNEPFTFTVTIRGRGNISGITEPHFSTNSGLIYTLLETNENIITEIDGISGGKDFIYSATSKRSGNKNFGKVSYAYYDPYKKEYAISTASFKTLNIAKGNGEAELSALNSADLVGALAPLRYDRELSRGEMFYKSALFMLMMSSLFISSLVFLSFSYKRVYESKNSDLIRKRKAVKSALAGVEEAYNELPELELQDFYSMVHSLMNRFYIDRYGLDLITHPLDLIHEHLDAGYDEKKYVNELTSKIKLLNYFRYSSKNEVTKSELRDFLFEVTKNIKGIQKCDR